VRDGVSRVVEVSATPLKNDAGEITGIVEVEHDITELIAANQRLQVSEQRFQDLRDTTAEFIWEMDRNARFTFVGERVRDVLGYEPSELLGVAPASLMPAEDSRRVREYFKSRGEGRPFNSLEHRSIRKDGTLVWQSVSSVPIHDANGDLIGARGVCQDITPRIAAEDKLQRSEANLRAIMDNVEDAIISFDDAGRITSANRWTEKLFAETEESVTDRLLSDFVANVLAPGAPGSGEADQASSAVLEGHRETTGTRSDGSEFPVDLWVGKMDLPDEGRYVALIRDMTETRRVQRELEQARLQYYHQEKMSAIGRLAAGILHEVNNPIAAITGSLEEISAIRESAEDANDPLLMDEGPRTHLAVIEDQVGRLSRVTREIADFASPRERTRELLDLNEIVRSTLRLMRYDRRLKQVTLDSELDKRLPAVEASADQLMQVLMNLLLNAADASEQLTDHHPVIFIRTGVEDEDVVLSVDDNCGGMSERELEVCKDAFFTTKPPGKGTGLGLAICDSIVSRHGGFFELDSIEGRGTTVRTLLPLRSEDA
jgi:PAS domain S-box-containing protein